MRGLLPEGITACLFDLDGVLTETAKIHAKAWKRTFDEELQRREGDEFEPFDSGDDYERFVDGKPRYDGVRSFMSSRGYELGDDEVHRIGDAKNKLVLELMREDGVDAYPGSIRFVRAAGQAGLHRAVVSSSANCHQVLEAAGIENLFEARIDGVTIEREGLAGKPAPDSYLAGARALGVDPGHAAVFEDALAGVEAGRAGGFGYVVGVNRADHGEALREHGADVVVDDLGDLLA